MKKQIFTALLSSALLSITSVSALAQETPIQVSKKQQQSSSSPSSGKNSLSDYGSIVIDWGFNFYKEPPQKMELSFLGSRSTNTYLYYNARLGQSHFTISGGTGLGFDRYQFKGKDKQYYTLVREKSSRNVVLEDVKGLFPDSKEILQSNLDLRYLDFLVEVRFNANRRYPKEGFFMA